MSASTNFQDLINKGTAHLTHADQVSNTANGGVSAAAAASNSIIPCIMYNALGTTFSSPFSTTQTLPITPGLTNARLINWHAGGSRVGVYTIAIAYNIGTLDLTSSTGNRLTHSAGTFPVTRTRMGSASQPVVFDFVMVQVTTTLATAAPVLTMASYVNQAGATISGTKTMTFPSVTTAFQSCFILEVEDGDSGVQDVTSVTLTSAASAGAATLWGIEIIDVINEVSITTNANRDTVRNGIACDYINPGAATSGTIASSLVLLTLGVSSTATNYVSLTAVEDA